MFENIRAYRMRVIWHKQQGVSSGVKNAPAFPADRVGAASLLRHSGAHFGAYLGCMLFSMERIVFTLARLAQLGLGCVALLAVRGVAWLAAFAVVAVNFFVRDPLLADTKIDSRKQPALDILTHGILCQSQQLGGFSDGIIEGHHNLQLWCRATAVCAARGFVMPNYSISSTGVQGL